MAVAVVADAEMAARWGILDNSCFAETLAGYYSSPGLGHHCLVIVVADRLIGSKCCRWTAVRAWKLAWRSVRH